MTEMMNISFSFMLSLGHRDQVTLSDTNVKCQSNLGKQITQQINLFFAALAEILCHHLNNKW